MRNLYVSDYYGWTQQQAELLRAGKLPAVWKKALH
ncbi:DUF29 domain-containing protein [Salmonella enterica]|nr:DUF29 domain-containing protein [Salmonella enterica]EDX5193511.1 DUF29 domain-containing protein [Salmonella enterica subsp. enterica serovar Glostrup]